MAFTAADLASAGTGQITVNNQGPGGSTSSAQTLTIVAPPVTTSVSPSTIQVPTSSSATATVTITGTNFAPNATVNTSGGNATIVSETSTQIVATLSYYQLYYTEATKLYVDNPEPGNVFVQSQPATVNIINPTAAFTISPTGAAVGGPDLTVTISGAGYFADSVVVWNGISLPTTYSSTNSLGHGRVQRRTGTGWRHDLRIGRRDC